MQQRRTGLVWDERYMWHDGGLRGQYLPHGEWIEPEPAAESPASKRRIRNLIEVSGMLGHLEPLAARPATRDQLLRYHTPGYVEQVCALSQAGGGDAGNGVSVARGGFEIAALAVGGCIAAVEAVLDGVVGNAYALVRPPGHHALPAAALGYCIFANISLAALHARHERGVGRIAVIDWDVHHANGTQLAFWSDPTVLTVSIHQDGYFPTGSGAVSEVGDGPGRYHNVNIPLPAGSGEGAYLRALEHVVEPAVRAFRPELIVVACGVDASMLDPWARMMLSSEGFRAMAGRIVALADEVCAGRLVLCHEGGYSTTYAPFCGLAILEELAGRRTEVVDPYLDTFLSIPGQALIPHQEAAVSAAAKTVDALRARLAA